MFSVEIGGFWHYMLKAFLEFLAILAFLAMIAFATRPPHPTIPTCLALRLNWPRHSGLPWSDPISGKYLQVQTMQWYLITRWGVRGQCNTITPPSAEPTRPLANLFITLIVLMASVQALNTRGSTNWVHIVLNRFHTWVHSWLSKKKSPRESIMAGSWLRISLFNTMAVLKATSGLRTIESPPKSNLRYSLVFVGLGASSG